MAEIRDLLGRIASATEITADQLKSLLMADVGPMKPTNLKGGGKEEATTGNTNKILDVLEELSKKIGADLIKEIEVLEKIIEKADKTNEEIAKQKEDDVKNAKGRKKATPQEEEATTVKAEKTPPTVKATAGLEQVVASLHKLSGIIEAQQVVAKGAKGGRGIAASGEIEIKKLTATVDSLSLIFAQPQTDVNADKLVKLEDIKKLPVKIDALDVKFAQPQTDVSAEKLVVMEDIDKLPVKIKSLDVKFTEKTVEDAKDFITLQSIDILPISIKALTLVGSPDMSAVIADIQSALGMMSVSGGGGAGGEGQPTAWDKKERGINSGTATPGKAMPAVAPMTSPVAAPAAAAAAAVTDDCCQKLRETIEPWGASLSSMAASLTSLVTAATTAGTHDVTVVGKLDGIKGAIDGLPAKIAAAIVMPAAGSTTIDLTGVIAAVNALPAAIAAAIAAAIVMPATAPTATAAAMSGPIESEDNVELSIDASSLEDFSNQMEMSLDSAVAKLGVTAGSTTPGATEVDLSRLTIAGQKQTKLENSLMTQGNRLEKTALTHKGCLEVCDRGVYKQITNLIRAVAGVKKKDGSLRGGVLVKGGGGVTATTGKKSKAKAKAKSEDPSVAPDAKASENAADAWAKAMKDRDNEGNPFSKAFWTPPKNFRMWKEAFSEFTRQADAMSEILAGVKISDSIGLGSIVKSIFEYNRGLRTTLFTTQGITGENKEMQNAWSLVGQEESIVAQTGQTITENMKVQQRLMGRGIKDRATVLRLTKTTSNFATMMDVKTEDTADLFGTWNTQLGMSASQIQDMSRGMQAIARQTGLSGQNVLEAAKSSEAILKGLRQSGNLTAEAAKNVIGMMASFKKAGVEELGGQILTAMKGPQGFLKAAPGIQAMLAQAAASMGKSIADLPDIMGNKSMMRQFGGNFKNQIKQIFGTLDFKNMSASQKFQANITAEAMGLGGIGDIERALGAMDEASMTFTERLRDSDRKIASLEAKRIQQGGVLSAVQRGELKALQDQQKTLRSGRLADFTSELRNMTDQGMSFGDAVNRMTANMSAQDRADMASLGVAGPGEAVSAMVQDMQGQLNDKMKRTFASMGMGKEFDELKKKLDPEDIQRRLREAVTQEDKDKVFDDLENAQNTLAMAQKAATDPTYAFQMRLKILNEKLVKFISDVVDKLIAHGLKFVEWLEGMGPLGKMFTDNLMNVVIGFAGITIAIGSIIAVFGALKTVSALLLATFTLFSKAPVTSAASGAVSGAVGAITGGGGGGGRGLAARAAGAAGAAAPCPPAGPPMSCPGTDTKIGKFDFKGMVGGAGQMIKAAIGMGLVVLGVTALAVAILKMSSVILKYSGMDEKQMLKTGATVAALIVGTGLIAEAVNQTKNAFERLNVSVKMVGKMILGAAALFLIATGVVALATAILWVSNKIIGLIGGPEEAQRIATAVLGVLWAAAQIGLAVAASAAVLTGLGALVAIKYVVPLMLLGALALLILTPAIIGLAYAVIKLADAAMNAIGTVDTSVAGKVANLLFEAGKIGAMILLSAAALTGLGFLLANLYVIPLMWLGAEALKYLTPAVIELAYAVIKLAEGAMASIGTIDPAVPGKIANLLFEAGKIGAMILLSAAALTGLGFLLANLYVIPLMYLGAKAIEYLTPAVIELAYSVIKLAEGAMASIGTIDPAVPGKIADLLIQAGKIGAMVALSAAALTGLGFLLANLWVIPMMALGAVALLLLTPAVIKVAGAVVTLSDAALSQIPNLASADEVATKVADLLKSAGRIALYIIAAGGGLALMPGLLLLRPLMWIGASVLKSMTPAIIGLAVSIINLSEQAMANLGNVGSASATADKIATFMQAAGKIVDAIAGMQGMLASLGAGSIFASILSLFSPAQKSVEEVSVELIKTLRVVVGLAVTTAEVLAGQNIGSFRIAGEQLGILGGLVSTLATILETAGSKLGDLTSPSILGLWGRSPAEKINEVALLVPPLVEALLEMARQANSKLTSVGQLRTCSDNMTALGNIASVLTDTLVNTGDKLKSLTSRGFLWLNEKPAEAIKRLGPEVPKLVEALVEMAKQANSKLTGLNDLATTATKMTDLGKIAAALAEVLTNVGQKMTALTSGQGFLWLRSSPAVKIKEMAPEVPKLVEALVEMARDSNEKLNGLGDVSECSENMTALGVIAAALAEVLTNTGTKFTELTSGQGFLWLRSSPVDKITEMAPEIPKLVEALVTMATDANAKLTGLALLNQTSQKMTELGNIVNKLTDVLADVGPKIGELTSSGFLSLGRSTADNIRRGKAQLVASVTALAELGTSMIGALGATTESDLRTTGDKLVKLGTAVENLANMLISTGPKIVALTGAGGRYASYTALITTASGQIPPTLEALVLMITKVGTASARVAIGDLIATGDRLNALANFIDTLSASLSNIGAKINALTSGQGFLWQWPSMTDIITNGSPQITEALQALGTMVIAVKGTLELPGLADMGAITGKLTLLGQLIDALSYALLTAGTSMAALTAGGWRTLWTPSLAETIVSGKTDIEEALASLVSMAVAIKGKLTDPGLTDLPKVSEKLRALGTLIDSLSEVLTLAGSQIEGLTTNRGWFQFRDNSFATRITNGSPQITEAITALATMVVAIKESLAGATEAIIDEVKKKLTKLSELVDTLSVALTNIGTKLNELTDGDGWFQFSSSLVTKINEGSTQIPPAIVALRQMVTAISAALTAGPSVGMMIATGDSLNAISNFVDTLSASLTNIGRKLNVLITGGLSQPWQTITNSIILASLVVPGTVTALLRMCRRIYWALIEDDTSLLSTTGTKLTEMSTFVDALSASLSNIGRKIGLLINTTSEWRPTLAQNITNGGVIIAAAVAALAAMIRAIKAEVGGTIIGELIATGDKLNALSNFVDTLATSLSSIANKINALMGGSWWNIFNSVVASIIIFAPIVPRVINVLRRMAEDIGVAVDGADFSVTIDGLDELERMVSRLAITLQRTSETLVSLTGGVWWESFGSVTRIIRNTTPAVTGAVFALRWMANAVNAAVQGIDFADITVRLAQLGIMVDALGLNLRVIADRLVAIREWTGFFSTAVANVRAATPVIAEALQSLTNMAGTIGVALAGGDEAAFAAVGVRLVALGDFIGNVGAAIQNAAARMVPLVDGVTNFSAMAANVAGLQPQIVGAIRSISSLIRDGIVAEASQIDDAEILQAVRVFDRVSDALLQLAVALEQVGQRMAQVEAARVNIPNVGNMPAMPTMPAMPAPAGAGGAPGNNVAVSPLTAPPMADISVVLGQISADIGSMLHHMVDVGSIQTHDTHIEKPIENIEKSISDVGDVVDKGTKGGKKGGAKAIAPDSLDVDASSTDAKLVPDAVTVKKLSLSAKEFNIDALGRQMQLSKLSKRIGSDVETGMSRQPLTANFDEVGVGAETVNDTLLQNSVKTKVEQPTDSAAANIRNITATPAAVSFDQATLTARAGEVAALTARVGTITAIPTILTIQAVDAALTARVGTITAIPTILTIQAVDVPALNVPVTNLRLIPTNTTIANVAALTLPVNALAVGGVVGFDGGGGVSMSDAVAPIGAPVFQPVGTDTVPAMLTPREFVVNARDAQANMGLLNHINQGGDPTAMLAKGGPVYLHDGGSVAPPTTRQSFGSDMANMPELRARQAQIADQLFGQPLPTTVAANAIEPAQRALLTSAQTVPEAARTALTPLANNANKAARTAVIQPLLPTLPVPPPPPPPPPPSLIERIRLDDTAWSATDRVEKIGEIVGRIRTELQNEAANVIWSKTGGGGNIEEEIRIGVKHMSDTLLPATPLSAVLTGLQGSDRGIYESIATLRDVEAKRERAEGAVGGLRATALTARGRGVAGRGTPEEVSRARVEYSNALRGMAVARRAVLADPSADGTERTALETLQTSLTNVQRAQPNEDLSRYLAAGQPLEQRLGENETRQLREQAGRVTIPERRRIVESAIGRAIGNITRYTPSVTDTQLGNRARARTLQNRVSTTDIQENIAKAMAEMDKVQHRAAIDQLIAQSMNSSAVNNIEQVKTNLGTKLAPTRTDLQTAMTTAAAGRGSLIEVAQKADVHARVLKAVEKVNSPTFRPDQVPGGTGRGVYGNDLSTNIEQAIAELPTNVKTEFDGPGTSTPIDGITPTTNLNAGRDYTIPGMAAKPNPSKLAAAMIQQIEPTVGAPVSIVEPLVGRARTEESRARRAAEGALAAMRATPAGAPAADREALVKAAQAKLVEAGAASRATTALKASEPYKKSLYAPIEAERFAGLSDYQRELLERSDRGDLTTIQGEGGAGPAPIQIPPALAGDAGLSAQLSRATSTAETVRPGIGDVTSFDFPVERPNVERILYKKDDGAVLREQTQGRNTTWSRWYGGNWEVAANRREAMRRRDNVIAGPGGMGGLPVPGVPPVVLPGGVPPVVPVDTDNDAGGGFDDPATITPEAQARLDRLGPIYRTAGRDTTPEFNRPALGTASTWPTAAYSFEGAGDVVPRGALTIGAVNPRSGMVLDEIGMLNELTVESQRTRAARKAIKEGQAPYMQAPDTTIADGQHTDFRVVNARWQEIQNNLRTGAAARPPAPATLSRGGVVGFFDGTPDGVPPPDRATLVAQLAALEDLGPLGTVYRTAGTDGRNNTQLAALLGQPNSFPAAPQEIDIGGGKKLIARGVEAVNNSNLMTEGARVTKAREALRGGLYRVPQDTNLPVEPTAIMARLRTQQGDLRRQIGALPPGDTDNDAGGGGDDTHFNQPAEPILPPRAVAAPGVGNARRLAPRGNGRARSTGRPPFRGRVHPGGRVRPGGRQAGFLDRSPESIMPARPQPMRQMQGGRDRRVAGPGQSGGMNPMQAAMMPRQGAATVTPGSGGATIAALGPTQAVGTPGAMASGMPAPGVLTMGPQQIVAVMSQIERMRQLVDVASRDVNADPAQRQQILTARQQLGAGTLAPAQIRQMGNTQIANLESRMGTAGAPVGTPTLTPDAMIAQLARLDRMHGQFEQASRDLTISPPDQRLLINRARQQLGITQATEPDQIRNMGLRVIESIENQLGIPHQRNIEPVRPAQPVPVAAPPRPQVGDFPAPQPGGVQVARNGGVVGLANGGVVGLANGGVSAVAPIGAPVFQPVGTDTVPAMLTPKEFVVNAADAQANMGLLNHINQGGDPTTMLAAKGGPVYLADGGGAEATFESANVQPIMPRSDLSMEHAVIRERVTSQPETQQVESAELETVADESEKQTNLLKDLKKIMAAIEEKMKESPRGGSVGNGNIKPINIASMISPNHVDTVDEAGWGEEDH